MGWFMEGEGTPGRFRGPNLWDGEAGQARIHQIEHGRALVLKYQLVLLTIFLLISCHHWATKVLTFLKTHSKAKKYSEIESRGRSTAAFAAEQRHVNLWQRFIRRTQSFLMKQPDTSIFVESWGMIIFLIAYFILTLLYLCYETLNTHPVVFAFRLGIMASVNIPFLYILGTKHSIVALLSGWSYEQVNVLHRWVGTVCVVCAATHTVMFLIICRFHYLIHHLWTFMGIIASTSFLIIGITSIPKIRERAYELFYSIHLVGSIIAIPAVYFHFPTAETHALLAGIAFLYDRIVRLVVDYRLVKCHLRVAAGETVLIQIQQNNGWLFKRKFEWSTGQHIFLTFPRCKPFQSHPFTISSSANCSDTLDLIIRARKGFSRALYDHCIAGTKEVETMWAIIHGPYGTEPLDKPCPFLVEDEFCDPSRHSDYNHDETVPLASQFSESTKKIVLVAGGAGITYTFPIFLEFQLANDLAIRNCKSVPFDLKFLWIIPDRQFTDWIDYNFRDDQLWITRESGRPNVTMLLDEMVDDVNENCPKCWISTCGPENLIREVRNFAANCSAADGCNISFHAEKFGW